MSLYKVMGVDVEMDFLDADFMERFENAYEKMQNAVEDISPIAKPSELIRSKCKAMKTFMIDVFGEEKHKEMFGDKQSIALYVQASNEIYEARVQQDLKYKQMQNKFHVQNQRFHGNNKKKHRK